MNLQRACIIFLDTQLDNFLMCLFWMICHFTRWHRNRHTSQLNSYDSYLNTFTTPSPTRSNGIKSDTSTVMCPVLVCYWEFMFLKCDTAMERKHQNHKTRKQTHRTMVTWAAVPTTAIICWPTCVPLLYISTGPSYQYRSMSHQAKVLHPTTQHKSEVTRSSTSGHVNVLSGYKKTVPEKNIKFLHEVTDTPTLAIINTPLLCLHNVYVYSDHQYWLKRPFFLTQCVLCE